MIGSQHFYSMEQFVDYNEFKSLEPEIMAGISRCKTLHAVEGLWGTLVQEKDSVFKHDVKEIIPAYNEFKSNNNSELSEYWSNNRENELVSKNKLTRYLKSKYGACDPYYAFNLMVQKYFNDSKDNSIHQQKIMEHFPKTVEWINTKLLDNIFTKIYSANIVYVENNGIPKEHFDGEFDENMVLQESTEPEQYVHFRNTRRGFYVYDPVTKDRVFSNDFAIFWDTRDWHCTIQSVYSDWSLRIDGDFTDKVKDYIFK